MLVVTRAGRLPEWSQGGLESYCAFAAFLFEIF